MSGKREAEIKVLLLGVRCHDLASAVQGWFTRTAGEPKPQWSHVALLFLGADGQPFGEFIIESVWTGTRLITDWRKFYDNKKHWWVACEMVGLTTADAGAMLDLALEYLGLKYDKWAIAKNAIDGALGHLVGHDVYLARRFRLKFWRRVDRYNICTWLAAFVAARAAQWHFVDKQCNPLKPEFVTPNDVEANVFFLRPWLYRCPAAGGRRPKDLDPRALAKLENDRPSALDY